MPVVDMTGGVVNISAKVVMKSRAHPADSLNIISNTEIRTIC